MGRKGVSKRKPKQNKPLSNTNTSGASRTRSGEHSVVTSLVKGTGTPLNRGGANPPAGSNKNRNTGS